MQAIKCELCGSNQLIKRTVTINVNTAAQSTLLNKQKN